MGRRRQLLIKDVCFVNSLEMWDTDKAGFITVFMVSLRVLDDRSNYSSLISSQPFVRESAHNR